MGRRTGGRETGVRRHGGRGGEGGEEGEGGGYFTVPVDEAVDVVF